MKRRWGSSILALVAALGVTAQADINDSIRVADGEVRDRGFSSVNGSITVGNDAQIRGRCRSVNGKIEVGYNSQVRGVSSVNGRVEIGDGTEVEESVSSVNGRVWMGEDARAEDVSTVNGSIELSGAEISGDVRTINGNINLDHATVGGSVIIEDPESRSRNDRRRVQRIVLEGGSVVQGDVIVENRDRDVELYLRDGSRVLGRVENAKVIEE